MTFRQPSAFTGLDTEYTAGGNPRQFGISKPSLDSGTEDALCPHDPNLLNPEPYFTLCPLSVAEFTVFITTTEDLTTAVSLLPTQTLAARAAIAPAPDYVQVLISTEAETFGGALECPPASSIENCRDNDDGQFQWTVATGFGAAYPFGLSNIELGPDGLPSTVNYQQQIGDVPGGTDPTNEDLVGLLRRPIDGLSYEGQPLNDAVDTLIPWSVFAANPSLVVEMIAKGVSAVRRLTFLVRVKPWYRADAVVSGDLMCVL